MITALLTGVEHWDEKQGNFVENDQPEELAFEHSLITISLWEARWQRAFLTKELSQEERIDYVGRCMITTPTKLTPTEIFMRLTIEDAQRIAAYITSSQSATVITKLGSDKPSQNKIITSEMIYYYMVELDIPIEFERWHINRLLTFIDLVSMKREEQNAKGKKGTFKPSPEQNKARAELNSKRLAQYGGSK